MKVPYSLQGLLFAPVFLVLLFVLKITCPSSSGCFADVFSAPAFIPLASVYKMFGPVEAISAHEPIFILGYWALVGLLVGLCFDIWRKGARE
ncbi:hypothetical protein KW785_01430 [Candidatus Parcubacteria bacterium]|nr:hypothetical protein [Candidatus Parcubacteria bacterium]